MRKPIIAGNWKMFKTAKEAVSMLLELKQKVKNISDREIIICPPYIALESAISACINSNITIGAQNVFWEEKGAFTGEIAPSMIKSIGCSHVIIGHSERRQFFGETNGSVNKKIFASLKSELIPIICVGESLNEREANKTFSVIENQINEGLKGLTKEQLLKCVLAYEPVWAIGTGKTASPAQAQEVHHFIRDILEKLFPSNVSSSIRILYGGSVKPDNIASLMNEKDIDGALVGGASLEADSFAKIIRY